MVETTDLLVIGAGVFGLWTARAAARAGMRVILAEADLPGAGASGGLVGALTPHLPGRWREFKAFQLQGLLTLRARAAELADETGIDPGYARCGRMTPLADVDARERALAHALAARDAWADAGAFEVLDQVPPEAGGLIAPELATFGLIRDTISGRVSPRLLIEALAQSVRSSADLRLGWRLLELLPCEGRARFDRGEIVAARIVVAAGWRTFDFLPRASLPESALKAPGVKGQAALLLAETAAAAPVVQAGGIFIVPHAQGRVAVGSTSETTWATEGPDAKIESVIEAARRLSPLLRGARVAERWAGIRPRAPGREPLVGALPGAPRVLLATGGYKIGFSVAHLVGDALSALASGNGKPVVLPDTFAPEAHGLRPAD